MTDRETKIYNLFIGELKNGDYLFLEGTFKYGDGLKGLTGYELEFLTEEMLDDRRDNYDWEEMRKDAVYAGQTELGLNDWVENVERWDGKQSILDDSYGHKSCVEEAMKEASERDGVEYEYINCTGGGRCFDKGTLDKDNYEWYVPENLELLQKLYRGYEE